MIQSYVAHDVIPGQFNCETKQVKCHKGKPHAQRQAVDGERQARPKFSRAQVLTSARCQPVVGEAGRRRRRPWRPSRGAGAIGEYNGVLENQSDPIAMVYMSKHEGIHVW